MFKQLTINSLFVMLFLFCGTSTMAQDQQWQVDLKEQLYNVSWILQANEGSIIAAGDKGLLALNNETGKVKWHQTEFKAVDKASYLNIDGLPLFYVEYQAMVGKKRGVIINANNGDVVYDTKDDDYRIKHFTMYPEQGCILFEVMKGNEQNIMKFDLKTWQPEWVVNLGEVKGLLKKAGAKFLAKSIIKFGPFFTNNDQVIIGMKEQIYGIDFKSGALVWQEETDKKIKALVYSEVNDKLYLGIRKSSKLKVLEPSSGKDVTPGKLKLRGSLLDVRPDKSNNLVLVETEGFNLIDPSSQTFKWKKSFKIDFLNEVIPYGNQYIAIGKSEDKGSIALVDANGKKVWDSDVKGYTYFATPTPKGMLYITTERANILDYENGDEVWKKDVKFKSVPAVTFDEKEDKVVIFENKKAYKFDLKTGDIELFGEDIELEEVKKSTPLVAEYVDAGYFISTDQHTSLLSPAGKVVYTKYFEPVKSIKGLTSVAQLGADLAGVDVDIKGSVDNIKTLEALSNGSYRTTGDQNSGKTSSSVVAGLYVGSNQSNMSTVFEVTNERFSNSQTTKDKQYIVTNSGGNYIFQLDKNSGSVEHKIELKDKTPDYILDEIDNKVILNEKNHLITCYKL